MSSSGYNVTSNTTWYSSPNVPFDLDPGIEKNKRMVWLFEVLEGILDVRTAYDQHGDSGSIIEISDYLIKQLQILQNEGRTKIIVKYDPSVWDLGHASYYPGNEAPQTYYADPSGRRQGIKQKGSAGWQESKRSIRRQAHRAGKRFR